MHIWYALRVSFSVSHDVHISYALHLSHYATSDILVLVAVIHLTAPLGQPQPLIVNITASIVNVDAVVGLHINLPVGDLQPCFQLCDVHLRRSRLLLDQPLHVGQEHSRLSGFAQHLLVA